MTQGLGAGKPFHALFLTILYNALSVCGEKPAGPCQARFR